jgi:two-component system, sporulation sensor kinase E
LERLGDDLLPQTIEDERFLNLLKEVERLDRLNLIGQIAGSIGHEVRNALTGTKGFLQLLGAKDEYKVDKEYFDMMVGEIDRAASLLNEFLSLAQNKTIEMAEHSLNNVIRSIAPLIAAEALKAEVNFGVILGEIPNLKVNEKEIRQLILNLTRNAIEATVAGRCIDIKTIAVNGEVIMTIRDEGNGIPPEVLNSIGTPFITTKEKGTGLGLSVCYNIAQRHNAKIDIDTSNTGTSFNIRFPI